MTLTSKVKPYKFAFGPMAPQPPSARAFDAPQVARLSLGRFEAELRVTPLGLLAVGGLVAAILLSIAPIIRAGARSAAAAPERES